MDDQIICNNCFTNASSKLSASMNVKPIDIDTIKTANETRNVKSIVDENQ